MASVDPQNATALLRTPLHALHVELGARMVPFASYDMPVQYPTGILAEHLQTRAAAGLFDVSHMGQALIEGPNHEASARALERLCPADLLNLAPGRQRYTQFLNAEGGIVDDLMVTRPVDGDGCLFLVVNASRKGVDFDLLRANLPPDIRLTILDSRALIALQGPQAAKTLARLAADASLETMPFMSARETRLWGGQANISRSGYTGEDGFEISIDAELVDPLARRLLAEPEVKPIGLGARDSLRLEAGLCLYGHELDETIDPIEAGLNWSIQKRRRVEGGFAGAARIHAALANGPSRKRIGIRPDGRAPARDGAEIVNEGGAVIGRVTSGGFGPSVRAPIAIGYVESEYAASGSPIGLIVRDKILPARVAAMPFHPHAYYRGL
jgi:aminomethyltransferase